MAGFDLGTARGRISVDSSSLNAASAGLTTLGKGMVVTGALGVAAFVGVIKSAADLEKTLSAVQAVSGATDKQMNTLRETALQLGSNTAFSANEIAGAMEDLAKAGITVEDITGGAAQAVVDLAAAAGDELPGGVSQGAEIIANAMKTFGASADQMEHFADVLVGAAASSTLNVEDLATSLKYAGPIASELGLSIDDLSTTLAILGDRGIKGSTAGTSLRGVLLSLTPTSKKAEEAMHDLGIITDDGANKFYDLHGNLKPIPEVMQILGDATKGLSEQEKVAAFNAIFQRRAMNAAMIMADQGAAGFENYSDAIQGIDASDVAETKLDNLSGDILKLKNRADALIKRVGKPLQDMVRGWVQGLTDLLDRLNELDPNLVAKIVLFAGVAGAGLIVVGMIIMMAGWFLSLLSTLIAVGQALSIFSGIFAAVTGLSLGWFLVIVAAIVAVAAGFYYAYTHIQSFRDAVDTAIDGVQSLLAPLQPLADKLAIVWTTLQRLYELVSEGRLTLEGFSVAIGSMLFQLGLSGNTLNTVRGYFDGFYATISSFWNWINNTAIPTAHRFIESINWEPILRAAGVALFAIIAPGVALVAAIVALYQNVDWFRNAVQATFAWIMTNVFPVIQDFGDLLYALGEIIVGIVQHMIPIWQAGFAMWVDIFHWVIDTVMTAWNLFGDNLLNGIRNTFNYIRSVIESVLNIVQGIINVVLGLITGDWGRAWDGIKQILSGVWTFIWSTIEMALGVIVLAVQSFFDLVNLAWQAGWDFIANTMGSVWDLIFELVRGALTGIWNFIKHIVDLIITPFQNLYNVLVGHSIIPDLMDKMTELFMLGLKLALGFFQDFPGRVIAAVQMLVGMVIGWANDVMNRMKDAISNGVDGALDFFSNLPGRIIDAVGDLGSLLVDTGRDAIQGLINGIGDMAGAVRDAVAGIAGDVAGGIAGALGIGSPSKLLHQYGQWTVEGFANGLEDKAAMLNKTLAMFEPSLGSGGIMPNAATSSTPTIQLNLDFSNGTWGEGAQQAVKETVNDPELLRKIINAAKAGVGVN